ncbi:MAG: hypothetical protein JO360_16655 [Acidobacteria bacterium]|nr:hypothetical protein [Acidobacteriota bacterium]
MMKHSCRLLIALLTFTVGVASALLWLKLTSSTPNTVVSTRQPDLASVRDDRFSEMERKLRAHTPDGWDFSRDGEVFTYTRREKVLFYNGFNMDLADRSDEAAFEKFVREHGWKDFYSIKLRVVPKVTKDDYARLKREREACKYRPEPGADFSFERWEQSSVCYHEHLVPIYFTDKESIFVTVSEGYIFPQATVDECRRVVESLDTVFRRYEKREASDGRP